MFWSFLGSPVVNAFCREGEEGERVHLEDPTTCKCIYNRKSCDCSSRSWSGGTTMVQRKEIFNCILYLTAHQNPNGSKPW